MIAEGTLLLMSDSRWVPVEELRAGMLLQDPLSSVAQRVKCVLRREIGEIAHSLRVRSRLAPVLLRKGALSDLRPSRNLLVSPQQQLLIRSMGRRNIPVVSLISAKALVSSGKAVRAPATDNFAYFVVITDAGGLILAENVVLKTVGDDEIRGFDPVVLAEISNNTRDVPRNYGV